MTDMLFERFAALADPTDDSDWTDVRRRARRHGLRIALPIAAAVAALVAAAAMAAAGGWIFSSHDQRVTAVTQVTLHGRTWGISLTTSHGRGFCFRVSASPGLRRSTGCGPGFRWVRRVGPSLGPPFGAVPFSVPGGQIWVGATVGFVRRIAITDANGRVHSTPTVAAPRGTRTPFRYWAIALDSTRATAMTAYDTRGRSIHQVVRHG